MSSSSGPSVYQAVLGARFTELDPRLRAYFGPIPAGTVGTGEGTFEVAGATLALLVPTSRARHARPQARGRGGDRRPTRAARRAGGAPYRQRVDAVVRLRGIGTVFRYRGSFTYELRRNVRTPHDANAIVWSS